jgi:sugar phosphate permease
MPEPEMAVGSRALVGAAVGAGVLYVVAVLAQGAPPGAADTGAQVVAWFQQHRDGTRWAVWALTLTVPTFAIMFALQSQLLPAPHREVFLIGAVTFIATTWADHPC